MAQTDLYECLHWCSNLVTTLPTQNMLYELICAAKIIFSVYFCPTWDFQGLVNGPNWSVWMSSLVCQPFSTLPTQNMPYDLICVANMIFSAYFCPFLAPIGQYLGHLGSGKWAKLIILDVLCAVPTLFQPVSLNRGSNMTIILKVQMLALLGPF